LTDPIPLPRGRQLVTLQGAGTHITKLPKVGNSACIAACHSSASCSIPIRANIVDPSCSVTIMRALNRHVERVFNQNRKDHHWGRRGS